MTPPTDDRTDECARRDESAQSGPPRRGYWGIALVLLALVGTAAVGASPVVGVGATTDTGDGGVDPTTVVAQSTDPVARCTVSATNVEVGETVTLDASASENADDYQYDKYGGSSFGDFTSQSSRTVSYGEPGTYEPRVKVWSYSGSESSDTAACGTVTVTEPATPTPTPTPASTPDATCTISATNVEVGETVTIDASGSENADDYQYDKYGGSSFGDFTSQNTWTVSYGEPGTYEPRVKVWSYSGSESSDTAACGTVTVTEPATPTPTPTPTPDATCTVSATNVEVGDSVTIDASGSENADDYQYDKYGGSSFGDFTSQSSRTVSYGEPGTYEPRVKVWSYSGSESSDVAACGTVRVTEPATPTPTPTSPPDATCTVSKTDVQVGETVTLDASGSENADDYQYDRYGGSSFGDFTGQSSRTVSYGEPGTYEPRVKVWSYRGGETSDVATCESVTVTESTPTPGSDSADNPDPTPTAATTATPVETAARGASAGTPTPAPTAGATSDSELWFRYSPDEPSAGESVRLVAEPAVAQDAVETHGWDVDGDGSVDRRGRVVELPAETGGETTVTLVVERVDGTTASVTRRVPVTTGTARETGAPERPTTGADGDAPGAALVGLVFAALAAATVARSRRDR